MRVDTGRDHHYSHESMGDGGGWAQSVLQGASAVARAGCSGGSRPRRCTTRTRQRSRRDQPTPLPALAPTLRLPYPSARPSRRFLDRQRHRGRLRLLVVLSRPRAPLLICFSSTTAPAARPLESASRSAARPTASNRPAALDLAPPSAARLSHTSVDCIFVPSTSSSQSSTGPSTPRGRASRAPRSPLAKPPTPFACLLACRRASYNGVAAHDDDALADAAFAFVGFLEPALVTQAVQRLAGDRRPALALAVDVDPVEDGQPEGNEPDQRLTRKGPPRQSGRPDVDEPCRRQRHPYVRRRRVNAAG